MRLKFDISGKGDDPNAGFTTYAGPDLPKGSYVAKVKRMTLGKISAESENKGKPRISILLEVVGGSGSNGINDPDYKYLGAPVWDGLNIIKQQTGRVNQFLHALTNGEKQAKEAIEAAFWPPNGPNADKVVNRRGQTEIHIKKIGRVIIGSPDGEALVRIITRAGKDLNKDYRPEVNQYLPYTGQRPEKSDEEEDQDWEEGMEDTDETIGEDATSIDDELDALGEPIANLDDEPPF